MRKPIEVYNQWHDDPTSDMYEYIDYLRGIAKGNILEIGVREGVSTACFLLGLEQHGGHLYSIDINADCGNLFDHPQWTFIDGDSSDWRNSLGVPTSIDILFIDGDHTHPAVDFDLFQWSKLVRDGGLILMHDIIPAKNLTEEMIRDGYGTPDVRNAYDRFIAETGYQHLELDGQFGLGVILKEKS
jgi:predicted O-methyltransferase YrrM